MNKPLISIIITVLNGGKTIRACLDSVANQVFTNFELILIDGGSRDDTLSIINEYRTINKTVRVLPGAGIYAGLNAGVNVAIGQWFYFIGCDDELYSPDTLKNVAGILNSASFTASILVGNVYYPKSGFMYRAKLGSPYFMGYQVHHQGMFYKKAIFDTLQYDETLRISSDYELNLKLVLRQVPHFITDLVICRFNHEGISHRDLQLGATEMQIVHKRVFRGVGRQWLMNYFTVRYQVGLLRERLHLVDLKAKLRRFIRSLSYKST